jgi:hypothetical protein
MGFSGWSPDAVEFFAGLQSDNTKAYWTAHKEVRPWTGAGTCGSAPTG